MPKDEGSRVVSEMIKKFMPTIVQYDTICKINSAISWSKASVNKNEFK